MVLYCAILIILFSSVIHHGEGIRGFYNNIQIASGSPLVFSDFSASSKKQEIPLDMLFRMNEVADTKDFIENFIYPEVDNTTLTTTLSQTGPETVERNSAITKAQMAICGPELKTVSIKPESDFTLFYHPSCIRVERCGGCCTHSLLTCTAVDSEIMHVRVILAEYRGGERLVHKGSKIIPVEKHTKCKCDCKIQPQDCTKSQRYNKSKCACECINTDAEKKCNSENKYKIWSKQHCACLCREELECMTGYYFDYLSCRCQLQEGRVKPSQRPWIA